MKTEQQLKNIRDALVWWQTVPEENVAERLSVFSQWDDPATNCKTVACFGGWCARWPGLIEQGLSLSYDGVPELKGSCFYRGIPLGEYFFGDEAIWRRRGGHLADTGFFGTDHELVTNRLQYALAH